MKLLIIDDDETSVKGIRDFCVEREWESIIVDFEEAFSAILDFDPDIIVLDWKDDAEKVNVGSSVLDKIWNTAFRPIILFSAISDVIDVADKEKESNMLKVLSKGDEAPVKDYLSKMAPLISELSSFRRSMSSALIASLNAIDFLKEVELDDSSIEYMLSKRVASFFDDIYISNISPSWVQYLCPPLGDCLYVCDIIRRYDDESDFSITGKPEDYRLILTPSCDMAFNEEREPKVSRVLCAKCGPKEKFHGKPLNEDPSPKSIKKSIKYLNAGYNNHYISLPGFSSIIPFMTADVKDLELLDLNCIAPNDSAIKENTLFIRVASVASPFREQIVWVYMLNSCRPGVPDRNMELWAKEINSI